MTSYRVRRPRPPPPPGALLVIEARLVAALRVRPGLWEAWRIVLAELAAPEPGWSRRLDLRRVSESLAWRLLTDQAERHGLTRRAAEEAAAADLGLPADTLRTRSRAFRGEIHTP